MQSQEQGGCSKRFVQQGRRTFGARSILEYVSTTKGRERRWRTFSTPPNEKKRVESTPEWERSKSPHIKE